MAVVLAAVAFGLCLGAAARAETETEREIRDLKERIDELEQVKEREIRDLKERIDKLEQVTERAKQAKEEIEKEIAGVESEAAEAKAEAGQALAKAEAVDLSVETDRIKHAGHNFTIAGTIITLSGFVKTDVIHDFQAINTPAKFTTSAIVVPGQGNGQTTFSANPSRLLFASATPTRIGQVSTLVSFDFFGDSTSRTPSFRLRQAWGQLDDFFLGGSLRIGQAWTSFDDVPSLPETLDFEGPNGSDQTRQPLVRWEREFDPGLRLWVSLEDPGSSIINGQSKTRAPDGILSLRYKGDWGWVTAAAVMRDIGASDGQGVQRKFGWGLSLGGLTNLPCIGEKGEHKDNVTWGITYGKGYGDYVNDGVNDGIIVGDRLELLPVLAGYVGAQHWWLSSLRSTATFGWVWVDNRAIQGPDDFNRTYYASANLVWSPVEIVDLGVEYLWGQRRNNDNQSADDSRMQFSAKLKF